jgi:hypothetical protein
MKCPHCGYQTDNYALTAVCALCGASFADVSFTGSLEKGSAISRSGKPSTVAAPLKWHAQTLYESFARPDVFFSGPGARGSSKQALVYGLVMGSIGTLLAVGISAILPSSLSSFFNENGIYHHVTRYTPAVLILTPLILIFQYYLSAAYVQVMLKISGSKPKPFAMTFKTVCYAGGAQIFEWIPFIGPFLSFIAWIYLTISGLHAVHGISRVRAASALLLPMVLLLVLLVIILIGGLAVVAMVGGSQPDIWKFFHH